MYVVLALLLLGVLIIAHEGGHFWAARACGIGVQEFSMGMGPLIAKWQSKKGTQFSVRLLPIGGYCQFYGEDEEKSSPICKPAACAVSSTCATFGTTAFTPMALINSAITRNAITKFISGPLNTVIARFQTGWLLNARGSFFSSSSP